MLVREELIEKGVICREQSKWCSRSMQKSFNGLFVEYDHNNILEMMSGDYFLNMDEQVMQTPLFHFVAMNGDVEMMKLFLSFGVDINIVDQSGNTALHKALVDNNKKIGKFLIQHGASMDIKNIFGETPIQAARSAGCMGLASSAERFNNGGWRRSSQLL